MRQKNYLTGLVLIFLFASVMISATKIQNEQQEEDLFPKEVNDIIQQKCFGCHNTDSRNEDAKKDLDLKTLSTLNKAGQIHAYREIIEVAEEGKMPPEKLLERFPDNALTDDDKKALLSWANSEMEKLK